MLGQVILLLFPLFVFAQSLEVRLTTRTALTPIYLSHFRSDDYDWRASEELREILETDLNRSGYAYVVQRQDHLEKALQLSDPRKHFDASFWKKENIPFCVGVQVVQNRLEVTIFNNHRGTSKKYLPVPLDRLSIHKLADAIQKDFFGNEGISSLKLIYTKREKNEQQGFGYVSEVWVCDADGANAVQITKENSYCLSPFFFPHSSTEFFYTSEKTGQSKIYRASLTNPEGNLWVDLRGNQALAAMKDQCIAFITDAAGRPDLFIQNLDEKGKAIGKARQLFSAPRATQASPTFSPDGKKIAFVSDKDGTPRIYVMDTVPKKNKKICNPILLTKRNRENTSPSWSPDGTKLAYSAKVDGVRQIWIYDFSTDQETALTIGPENKENPSWAPDSFHLVYNTESEEVCDLYIAHLKSMDPIQIGKGRFASWQQHR